MTSWLRGFGLRVALLSLVIASVLVAHASVARRSLPFALLDAFDQAFGQAYDAAERKVVALEAARPAQPAGLDLSAMLGRAEREIAAACDIASAELDVELAVARWLSPERRRAVLGCIERHLGEAREAQALASDPEERAEYAATCERLREVRGLIQSA
jgi:hypothetical protein